MSSRFPASPSAHFPAAASLAFAAALALVLALAACSNDESAPPPKLGLGLDGAFFAHADTSRILEDRAPTAASPGRLARRSITKACAGGEMVSDTVMDTTFYVFGEGGGAAHASTGAAAPRSPRSGGAVLRLWSEGDCLASRLAREGRAGKGSPLSGTWTLDGQDSVPPAWRPAACKKAELAYAIGPSGSYVFSQDLAIFRTNGAFCMARVFGEAVARALDSLEVSKGCDEVTLRWGGREAVLSGEIAGDGVLLRLARKDAPEKACQGILPLALRPPETCALPNGAADAGDRGDGGQEPETDTGLNALSACLADFILD